MKNLLIYILIIFVIICGCTQTSEVAGVYENEAHMNQQITMSEIGSFTHNYYNFSTRSNDAVREGNYTVKKSVVTLAYSDGEISEFYIDGNELVQINGNTTDSPQKIPEIKYAKVILQR